MKRLLTVALALLLLSPVLACPPRAIYYSPNGRFSLSEFSADQGMLQVEVRGYSSWRSIFYGSRGSDFAVLDNSGSMVAVVGGTSVRLFSSEGKVLDRGEVPAGFGHRIIGGWIEGDGTCFWETRQGELWIWRRRSSSLEKVAISQIQTVSASADVSAVSILRWAVSNQVPVSKDWLAAHKRQVASQADGQVILQFYYEWAAGKPNIQLLEILSKDCLPFSDWGAVGQRGKVSMRRRTEQICCLLGPSKWIPAWLITKSDAVDLQRPAASDPEVLRRLVRLYALKPDLPITSDLVKVISKLADKNPEPYYFYNLVSGLEEAEADPRVFVELLSDSFPAIDDLLDFYSRKACLEAVPLLLNLLAGREVAVRRALFRQLRVDLGRDSEKWNDWISQVHHNPADRGRVLIENGDSGGMLWLGRTSELRGTTIPRLVQRISAEDVANLWIDGKRVGCGTFHLPQSDWCWDLATGTSYRPLVVRGEYFGLSSAPGQYLVQEQFDEAQRVVFSDLDASRFFDKKYARSDISVAGLLSSRKLCTPIIEEYQPNSLFYRATPAQKVSVGPKYRYARQGGAAANGRWCLMGLVHDNGEGTDFALWNCAKKRLELPPAVVGAKPFFDSSDRPTANLWSPDSRWLAVGGEKLTLVSTEGDAPHVVSTQAIKARSLAFQPKADRIAVGSENELVLMHLPDLKVEQIIRGLGPVNGLAYSPDGSMLAVALQDEIRVYQTNSPWPTQDGQDPQLLSELWTGMRLSGGAAVRLSEAEFKQRLARWKSETGSEWWDGCPKPVSQPGRAEFPPLTLAGLVVSAGFLGYSLWSRRRS